MHYGVIRNEEKRSREINKVLVLEFNKLQLRRDLTGDGEEGLNIKRMKVGESSRIVKLGVDEER